FLFKKTYRIYVEKPCTYDNEICLYTEVFTVDFPFVVTFYLQKSMDKFTDNWGELDSLSVHQNSGTPPWAGKRSNDKQASPCPQCGLPGCRF
ncbi:MAG: hypothetical protein IJ709_06230, partial [Selenomonas sp.]|nr:hypothetical protein [Selenomonas sp.]